MIFCIVIGIASLLVIIASLEVQRCFQKKIDYEKIQKISKTWKMMVENIFNKHAVYYIQRRYTTRPKCDKCDKNRNVDAVCPDGTIVKVPCSCQKCDIDYDVGNFLNNVKCLCWSDGHISYYPESSYSDSCHFVSLEEAIKEYDVYKWDYDCFLFTSKEEAEKFAEYLRKNERK